MDVFRKLEFTSGQLLQTPSGRGYMSYARLWHRFFNKYPAISTIKIYRGERMQRGGGCFLSVAISLLSPAPGFATYFREP